MSMCSCVLVFGWKVIPPPIMTYIRLQGLQRARPVFVVVVHFLGAPGAPVQLAPCRQGIFFPRLFPLACYAA